MERKMDGRPGGVVDRVVSNVADNAWLRAFDKIAMPLVVAIIIGLYTTLQNVQATQPLMAEQIRELRTRVDAQDVRALAARAERIEQYQSVIVEIASLKGQVNALKDNLVDQRDTLKAILEQLRQAQKTRAMLEDKNGQADAVQ